MVEDGIQQKKDETNLQQSKHTSDTTVGQVSQRLDTRDFKTEVTADVNATTVPESGLSNARDPGRQLVRSRAHWEPSLTG